MIDNEYFGLLATFFGLGTMMLVVVIYVGSYTQHYWPAPCCCCEESP